MEFIEEYYFMTEILDMNNCSKQECDDYVSYYMDIYNGNESLKSTMSVFLHKEQLSEEVLDIIYILDKCIFESEVSVQEKNRIKRFMEEGRRKKETIYDYAIEQLINIFQWGFVFDDALLFEPKSILHICDEVDLRENTYKKIKSIIASLLGNKPIWITCIYDNGKCELQVEI